MYKYLYIKGTQINNLKRNENKTIYSLFTLEIKLKTNRKTEKQQVGKNFFLS